MKFASLLFILISFSACHQDRQITNAKLEGLHESTPDSACHQDRQITSAKLDSLYESTPDQPPVIISDDYSIVRDGQKMRVPAGNLPVMVYGEPKNVIEVAAHHWFENKGYIGVYNIVDISLLRGNTSIFYRDQFLYEFEEYDLERPLPIRFVLDEKIIDGQSFLFIKGNSFLISDVGLLYVDGKIVASVVRRDGCTYSLAAIKKVEASEKILVRFENGKKKIFGYFDQKSQKIILPSK